MARGINKVILVGNLGADPEVRYTPSGLPIANLTLATSESWKDKQTGETKEKTEWHRVVVFNRLAEIAAEYLKKGSMVYIEGALQTRKWQDQTGQDRYTTEVVVNIGGSLQILSSRNNRDGEGVPQAQSSYSAPTAASKAKPAVAAKPMPTMEEPPLDFDDDIPF